MHLVAIPPDSSPLRAEKKTEEFRNYTTSARNDCVAETYHKNHKNQTTAFVHGQISEYTKFQKGKMTIWQMIERLNEVVDDSDPDVDFPQIFHAMMTAEALREKYPEIEWLPLVGLIHDLGKVMVLPEFGGLPQWAVVGDTFPVGCAFSDKIVHHEFFQENVDSKNSEYNTTLGMYTPNCGLGNVTMAWGHDEYMYRVCVHNASRIPQLGLDIIRFHSFYAWHGSNAYEHLMSDSDFELRKWAHRFSKCDLYSKSSSVPTQEEIDSLKPFYERLIYKYFPDPVLEW
jgi:inositol oxygenase